MRDRDRPTPHGAGRFLFLGLLLGALTAPTLAAPPDKPKLQVARRIVLAPIRADEIVPGAPSISAGATSATLAPQGAALRASLAPPDASGLAPIIARPMTALWSLKFTPNDDKPLGFIVSYELTSPDGTRGALGNAALPGARLTATVNDRPPLVETRRNGMMDVTGDAELEIDTSSVAVSGQYVGGLLITVTYL